MKKVTVAVIVVALFITACLIYNNQSELNKYNLKGRTSSVESSNEYVYNSEASNVLLVGLDSIGEIKASDVYGDQAFAESIELITFNSKDKTIRIIPISGSTVAKVSTFTPDGKENGRKSTKIGNAFAFGNGANASCINTCNAVSNLFSGIEIKRYVTTNLDSISYVNDLVGGVTVTVPNDDLTAIYPEMKKGNQVKISAENIKAFLRYSNDSAENGDSGRIEREGAYLAALLSELKSLNENEYEKLWNSIKAKSSMKMNISKDSFSMILECIRDYQFDETKDILEVEGSYKAENGDIKFYPDTDKLNKLANEMFFTKASGK